MTPGRAISRVLCLVLVFVVTVVAPESRVFAEDAPPETPADQAATEAPGTDEAPAGDAESGEADSGEADSGEADSGEAESGEVVPVDPAVPPLPEPTEMELTIGTLRALIALQADLRAEIRDLNERIVTAGSSGQKQNLVERLEKLDSDLTSTNRSLHEIAAGANLADLRASAEPRFSLQEELVSLVEPAIKEMKDMTSHVRQKSEIRDKIAYYRGRLPIAGNAVDNLQELLANTDDEAITETLTDMLDTWSKQETFLNGELQAAQLQLRMLESNEVSIAEASRSYFKAFFQARGLYLGQAILVVLLILLLSRVVLRLFGRLVPGFRKKRRSFQVRLLELSHRLITGLLVIIGPMVVFYLAEDWLLFSIGILFLFSLALAIRRTFFRYWQQIQLYLNVGTVREGERVELDGLPWRVQQINFYTMLDNPVADLVKRVKIDDLVDLRSRPLGRHEPWFPCRQGDWILLKDGKRGRVTGISTELVRMVPRGGGSIVYPTAEFLDQAPQNLSLNFRLRETIGISYSLQSASVNEIPVLLRDWIAQRIKDEEYDEHLLNLRVEFEKANTSSLDLLVIADFDGELADIYNRLRRSIQRWCVEACSEHGWEIPFTQITLHRTPDLET